MSGHVRAFIRSHPQASDSVLAVVLAALLATGVIVQTPSESSTLRVVGWVLFAMAALPLATRRSHPYICLVTTLALTVAGSATSQPFPPVVVPAAVALYTVGTLARGWRLALVAGGSVAVAIVIGILGRDEGGLTRSTAFEVAWVIGALALGAAVANRRAYVEQMRQRALEAERTKEEEAQRRVNEERMRIAREVHDGVAHALASISIQAGAGSKVLDRDPEAARKVFGDIRAASGSALTELRATLGLLRHGDDGPGADVMDRKQVDQLAAVLRAEGIQVRVGGDSAAWTLAGEAGAALHRILQEALTNVLRHSDAGEVELTLRRTKDEVVLTVIDNGRGVSAGAGETRGYGLVGMRERASLLGGWVESGPRPGGGFQVRAKLPLQEDS
jgi:signal transduction histidine kinase